jgi:hypothetical protein
LAILISKTHLYILLQPETVKNIIACYGEINPTKKRYIMKKLLLFLTMFGISTIVCTQELAEEISELDTILFKAVNEGKLDIVKEYFSPDLEFYHDTGGLDKYQGTIDNLKRMFANPNRPTRSLVENSMQVYPIKDYGAIQTGKHTFCHTENGKPECGTFDFLHVWQKQDEKWQITRVVSYGH